MPSRLENDPENIRRSCMQHSIQQFWEDLEWRHTCRIGKSNLAPNVILVYF
jgi:hypothetical protein